MKGMWGDHRAKKEDTREARHIFSGRTKHIQGGALIVIRQNLLQRFPQAKGERK